MATRRFQFTGMEEKKHPNLNCCVCQGSAAWTAASRPTQTRSASRPAPTQPNAPTAMIDYYWIPNYTHVCLILGG